MKTKTKQNKVNDCLTSDSQLLFSLFSEEATVPRVEAANASEILDRYLRCYDKRTRPNVTGIDYLSMRCIVRC